MDKRDLIPAAVCILLLIGYTFYTTSQQVRPPPRPPEVAAAPGSSTPPASPASPALPGSTAPESPLVPVVPGSPSASASTTGDGPAASGSAATTGSAPLLPEFASLSPAAPVKLRQGDHLEATIDPELGGLVSVVLEQVKSQDRQGPMVLGDAARPMLRVDRSGTPWAFSRAVVRAADAEHVVIARQVLGTPLVLEQSWTFDKTQAFTLDYTVVLRNTGTTPLTVDGLALSAGTMQPLDTPAGMFGAGGIDQCADLRLTGKENPTQVGVPDIIKMEGKSQQDYRTQALDWAAIQNKYFALLISGPPGSHPFTGMLLHALPAGPQHPPETHLLGGELLLPTLTLAAGSDWRGSFNVFVGAKHFDLLAALGDNKKSIMGFDLFLGWFHFTWMEWISRTILWALTGIEHLLGNYGVAIAIVTIVLRVLFFPLTHRTTVLSKRMQKLQPLMKELKEKYASDPAKMNAKTMELYREHKINPLGGCLPVLVQIPVFFALFNVLRSAIELRQRGFLWATDLSLPDTLFMIPGLGVPLNPLAILMGGTMLLQQHLMPTSPDPAQQKMMLFMSVFFVFMLYTMPSGLTLYWTTNQVCAIIQYRITQRLLDKEVGLTPKAA